MRSFITETAVALGCDPSFVALAVLIVVAACIGNRRAVVVKSGWTEPAVLWGAIIGGVSSLKSPAMAAATTHLMKWQQRRFREYEEAMKIYDAEQARYEAELNSWKKSKNLLQGDQPEPPIAPACKRYIVRDATLEALVPILAENPEGILSAPDELAGLLNSFNSYKGGKGGDKENYLSMHRADSIVNDRKIGRKIYHVPRAAVSICGTIQMSVFARFATDPSFRECGLISRLLIVSPPPQKKQWTDRVVSDATLNDYSSLIDELLGLEMPVDEEGNFFPLFMGMTTAAKSLWIEFYNSFADETANEEDEHIAGTFGKLEGQAARFALIFQLVDDPHSTTVKPPAMRSAIALARWFAHEAKRVYESHSETDEEREQRQLIELIQRRGGEITARELTQYNRRYKGDSIAAELALLQLQKSGIGELVTVQTTSKPKTVFKLLQRVYVYESLENKLENDRNVDVDNVDDRETRESSSAGNLDYLNDAF
ncbi:MAG: YfjI family protein [Planctomycetota bacterium]|nr:YfjI family protein [Planctomycetota bacterium]MDA1213250.1 YfjI family protein [Planctomycetota bacterium]